MGGRPLTAMNLLAFPCSMGADIVGEVVRGGAEKVAEAGAVTVGGHTIDDKEPKFGLSVIGVVHPDKVVRNRGALPGDVLVPHQADRHRAHGAPRSSAGSRTRTTARDVIESMATLNRAACEAMVEVGVHAATDVTGFGLLGHLHEMAEASGVRGRARAGRGAAVRARARATPSKGVVPGRTADVVAWADEFAGWERGSRPRAVDAACCATRRRAAAC